MEIVERGKQMDFSERLKQLRLNKGWSQRDLAKKLGLTNVAVSMYERGERQPDYAMLELICDTFNVSIDYILGKDDVTMYYLKPEQSELLMKLYADEELYALVKTILIIHNLTPPLRYLP
jgi:transcriptional regulator with XRE-family HTH domain